MLGSAGQASAAACPGADPCPWSGTPATFGAVAPESLRLANDIAFDTTNDFVWVIHGEHSQLKRYNADTGVLEATVGSQGDGAGQFDSPRGLAVDATGNVYVADTDNNRVQKLSPTGAHLVTIGDGTQGTGNNQLVLPLDVAADSAGNIYVADTENQRIQKFNSSGTYLATIGGPGAGDGQFGNFSSPGSLAIDASDRLYAADPANSRIQKFDNAAGFHAFLAETGASGPGLGQFNFLRHIAVDPSGTNLYAAESTRLQRMDAATGTFGANPAEFVGSGKADGEVSGLVGVAAGPDDVYTVESHENGSGGVNRVQRFDATGTHLLTFATDAEGQLLEPSGMATDSAGSVYVADTNKDRVLKFNSDGTVAWVQDVHGSGDGEFFFPMAIATDGTDVWVVDSGNDRIQRLSAATGDFEHEITAPGMWDTNGSFLTGITLHGSDLFVADPGREVVWKVVGQVTTSVFHGTLDTDGQGNAELHSARATAVQGTSLWIADTGNARVKKVALSDGSHQLAIGTAGSGNDQFSSPSGIAATADYVYVADSGNNRVQRRDATGAFLDRWGEGGDALGEFNFPTGVATVTDSVFVLDRGNDRVQRFTLGPPSGPPPPSATTPTPTVASYGPATRDTTPNLTGTASNDAGDEATVTLRIYSGSSATGPPVRILQVTRSGGSWLTVPSTWDAGGGPLADGTYTVKAFQTNPGASPQTGESAPRSFEIDNTGPVVELSAPTANSTTTSVRPAVSGSAGAKGGLSPDHSTLTGEVHRWTGSAWQHLQNWNITRTGVSFSSSVPLDLSPGTYFVRVRQGDAAGNANPLDGRSERQFNVEAPAVVSSPPVIKITSPAHDSHMKNRRPTITGTSDTSGQVKVDLYRFNGRGWTYLVRQLANVSLGSWSVNVGFDLPDGTYTAIVSQTNLAAQTGTTSGLWYFTVDNTPPAQPWIDSPRDNFKIGTNVPAFAGTADSNAGTTQVYIDVSSYRPASDEWRREITYTATRNGENWSFKPTGHTYKDGWYSAFAYQFDRAGNYATSFPVDFQVDVDARTAENPGKDSDYCQSAIDYGPFHVEGDCLKRRGLTWISTEGVKINGIGLEPVGDGEIVIDPFNLRLAATGRGARVTLGPTRVCLNECLGREVGPFKLYEGPFDWSWKGDISLPGDKARFGVPAYGGVSLEQLPGLAGFNLPQLQVEGWGAVNAPNFRAIRGIDIAKLTLPSINAANVELPSRYFENFKFNLPSLSIGSAGSTNILGFPIDGRLALGLTNGGVSIDAALTLPPLLGGMSGKARVFVNTNGQLSAENLELAVPNASLGPFGFNPLKISYRGAENLWRGDVGLDLPIPGGLRLNAVAEFMSGELVNASAGFDRDIALGGSGIFINGGSIFLKTFPDQLVGGTVDFGLGPRVPVINAPVVGMKTKLTYKFVSPGYFRFDSGINVFKIPLASAFVQIFEGGTVDFGGRITHDLPLGFSVNAYAKGWFQIPEKRFNIAGGGSIDLGDWIRVGADVTVSHRGVGGCTNWGDNHFGATYPWGGSVNIMWNNCGVGPVEGAKAVSVRAAQATQSFSVPASQDAYVLGFRGRGGAPDVNLTGPKGERFSTAGKSGPSGGYLVIHVADEDTTYVVIDKPSAGSWRVSTTAGSVLLDRIQRARTIDRPKIDARVTGRGDARTLVYDASSVGRGQRVTFVEDGPQNREAVIGQVGPGKGSLRFTPMADRSGRRVVNAIVSEDGFDRFRLNRVAVFRASKPRVPAAPGRVVAKRKKGKRMDTLAVSWTPVSGAATYRVTAIVNGQRRMVVTERTRVKIRGLYDRSGARVSVAGVNVLRQVGKAKRAKVAAPKAKHPPKRRRKKR